MPKKKIDNLLAEWVAKIVDSSVEEVLESSFLCEDESSKRKEMTSKLDDRYLEEDDEEEVESKPKKKEKDSKDTEEKGINKEKIVPPEIDAEEATEEKALQVSVPSEEQLQAPEYELVVNQVNDLRAGSSLRDERVSENFRNYFDSLPEDEKTALLVYTTALAQILKGRMPADEIIRLKDAKPKNSEKEASKEETVDDDGIEVTDRTTPVDMSDNPIVVGESVAVKSLLKKVRSR